MSRTARTACLVLFTALALTGVSVPAAHANPRVYFRIGLGVPVPVAPAVVAAPPPPPVYGMVWQPGYYAWSGYRYAWVPGIWVRPPFAGAVWMGPRWVRGPRGAFWARGSWRR
jgi:hypothetical protein